MTGLAVGLVLASALAHAYWNFLLKRASNQEVFVWLLLAVIGVAFSPLGLALILIYPIHNPGWWFVLGTCLLHFFYFLFLGRAYSHEDLSVVYPIARGIGPILVPLFAVWLLKESVDIVAIVGICAVVTGIFTVYWWGRIFLVIQDPLNFLKGQGIRYAMLTGVVVVGYSVWDKQGVEYVDPFLYMYLCSVGTALLLAPYILRKYGFPLLRAEWNGRRGNIITASSMMFLAYGLVLTAFTTSKVSYVAPFREVGILIGVLLGILVLKERFGKGRVLGSLQIVSGLVLIAIAP